MTNDEKIVAKEFATEKEMHDWLYVGDLSEIKDKYPPSEYSADLDMVKKKVYVTPKNIDI